MNVEKLTEAIIKAKDNLVNFRKIILKNGKNEVSPASFHYDWSDLLLKGKKHVAIEGFRESAKDQIVNRSFPLHAITFPSEDMNYIVIIRNNDTQAVKSLDAIHSEAISNPIINQRIKRILKKSANVLRYQLEFKDKIITLNIEAYGKGASIRGLANIDKRPDIIICNDLQDLEDSKSDTVQEKDWEWFLSDVKFLGQYTRIFLIGNNLGERCIIERVFADPVNTGFECHRVKICDDNMENPTWGDKYTIEDIKAERREYDNMGKLPIWLRERLCLAVSDATRLFLESDYMYYSKGTIEHIVASAQEVFATLDPASSPKLDSCFRAIIVNARMKDGHWYLIDVPFGRWDSVELMNQMFDVVKKYGIRRFGIEKGHFKQILEPFIYKEMTRRNIRFNIVPIEHAKVGSKLERIKMLQPRFKAKSIWFAQDAEWLPELKSELAGVTNKEIKSLYIDLVDALAMCEQMDVSLEYCVNRSESYVENLPRRAVMA